MSGGEAYACGGLDLCYCESCEVDGYVDADCVDEWSGYECGGAD